MVASKPTHTAIASTALLRAHTCCGRKVSGVSDPYGNNPSGQSPYGQNVPGHNPYGGNDGGGSYPPPPPGGGGGGYSGGNYGGNYGGDGFQPAPSTDGISIAALVLSFLCCLAPIGVILGFVGLGRTKNGQRKGRGLAVAAIPIGIVMTIAVGVGVTFIVIFAKSVVTPDNAEAGQCVNISTEDGDVLMREKDCSEDHDGEIVAVTEIDDDNIDEARDDISKICPQLVDPADAAKLRSHQPELDFKAVTDDPEDVEVGDHLVCYVQSDKKLDESLL